MLYNSVSLPDMLLSLINEVKKAYMPHWILVLPLLHLLKGTSKPFEASSPGKLMNVPSWAGLEGIDDRSTWNVLSFSSNVAVQWEVEHYSMSNPGLHQPSLSNGPKLWFGPSGFSRCSPMYFIESNTSAGHCPAINHRLLAAWREWRDVAWCISHMLDSWAHCECL